MAHKTLIDGTAYEISGGKALVDGTAYSIKNGKTLVGGTAYEVDFQSFVPVINFGTLTFTYSGLLTNNYWAQVNSDLQEADVVNVNAVMIDGAVISFSNIKNPNSGYWIWSNFEGGWSPASAGQYQVYYREVSDGTNKFDIYSFTDISGCEIVLGTI